MSAAPKTGRKTSTQRRAQCIEAAYPFAGDVLSTLGDARMLGTERCDGTEVR